VRRERRRQQLFEHPSDGTTVGAHPPLFVDDIALGIKLAHDRTLATLGLQVRPQLERFDGSE
jgi:hypothetical protein